MKGDFVVSTTSLVSIMLPCYYVYRRFV